MTASIRFRSAGRASHARRIVVALVAFAVPSLVLAADWNVDTAKSSFVVVTRKDGLAAGLAHDHLVAAPRATVTLAFDADDPASTRATFSTASEALDIDSNPLRARLAKRLHELGAGPDSLPEVSEGDRKKVRSAMLGESQLAAAKSPEIRAELGGLEKASGDAAFPWRAKLRLTVRGKAVEHPVKLSWEAKDGALTAEALGEFRFREFGIEPYSAMLGAVRNQDRFFVYVTLEAKAN